MCLFGFRCASRRRVKHTGSGSFSNRSASGSREAVHGGEEVRKGGGKGSPVPTSPGRGSNPPMRREATLQRIPSKRGNSKPNSGHASPTKSLSFVRKSDSLMPAGDPPAHPLPKPAPECDKCQGQGSARPALHTVQGGTTGQLREISRGGESPVARTLKLTQSLSRPPPQLERQGSAASNQQSRFSPPQSEALHGPSIVQAEAEKLPESCVASEIYRQNTGRIMRLRTFTYHELRTATKNFSQELVLGVGGFGPVYKGFIRLLSPHSRTDGRGSAHFPQQPLIDVAIKKLDSKSLQGHKEWMMEVSMLGLLEHPYLVKLIGFCSEYEKRLLVYEYLPNASLDRFIFGTTSPLGWSLRLRVALEAAKGLAYLHEEVDPQVIYRDFKTTNILLDADFHAKLSDFGLAREGPKGDDTHVSTQVRGTAGYAAPEYILTGRLTPKNDVWSFGVVLLELLTGRPCLDPDRPAREHSLVQLCRPYLLNTARFPKIVDSRLKGTLAPNAMQKMVELAKWCLAPDYSCRPLMSEAVLMLALAKELQEEHEKRQKVATGREPMWKPAVRLGTEVQA